MNLLKFFLPFFKMHFGIGALAAGLIGGGMSTLGGLFGGLAQGQANEEMYKRRKQAYDEMINRASQTQQAGETAFNDVVNTQNPFLQVIGQDLKNNTNDILNQGRNQMLAGFSQAGLRGGQAATQLARGVGSMAQDANRDYNQMMYGDYNQNRNLKAAYEQAKALTGINAGLQQFQG